MLRRLIPLLLATAALAGCGTPRQRLRSPTPLMSHRAEYVVSAYDGPSVAVLYGCTSGRVVVEMPAGPDRWYMVEFHPAHRTPDMLRRCAGAGR